MKGFPKSWNTKEDVKISLEKFPETTKEKLSNLVENSEEWIVVKKLDSTETGIENETHRVREVEDDTGNVVERYQDEYKIDPNGTLFRLGFETIDEAKNLLGT